MPGLNSILFLISSIEIVEKGLDDGVYVRGSLQRHQDELLNMNVSQLYEKGMNSLGVSIDSYAPYSPYTVQVKQQKGQPYDRVTLRDTGAFQNAFIPFFGPDSFYITSTDPKTQELIEIYGPAIFGLTEENKNKLTREKVVPEVLKEIREEIFQ